jgi:hypothetical protein
MSNKESQGAHLRVTSEVAVIPDYRTLVDLPNARLLAPSRCSVRVDVEGEAGLAFAKFDVGLIDRRFRVLRLTAEPNEGDGLNLYEVQRLDMGYILRAGLAHLIQLRTQDGEVFTAEHPVESPDPHVNIALAYSVAHALGDHPVAFVARDLGISAGAAAQRVRRARAAGYLPPTTPGKAS